MVPYVPSSWQHMNESRTNHHTLLLLTCFLARMINSFISVVLNMLNSSTWCVVLFSSHVWGFANSIILHESNHRNRYRDHQQISAMDCPHSLKWRWRGFFLTFGQGFFLFVEALLGHRWRCHQSYHTVICFIGKHVY